MGIPVENGEGGFIWTWGGDYLGMVEFFGVLRGAVLRLVLLTHLATLAGQVDGFTGLSFLPLIVGYTLFYTLLFEVLRQVNMTLSADMVWANNCCVAHIPYLLLTPLFSMTLA